MPVISFPADGDEITSTSVELTVTNAEDVDGDGVGYYFEIDTEPGFNSADRLSSVLVGEGTGTTSWPVSGLNDNTTYYWRAMATDTATPSQWVAGRFFVNTENDQPDIPHLKNPGEDAWVGVLTPNLTLADGVDADNDSLTYRYEVYTEPTLENLVAWGESLSTTWTVVTELTDKTQYYWRARAIDEHGSEGSWMATASFFIKEEEQPVPDAIKVQVSTDKGRLLENIRVYAFTAAGAYAGINSTTGSDGRAIFDIDALAPAVYQFRADYLGSQFWSEAVAIPENVTVPILIDEETVTVTAGTEFGTVSGARVYLFSESGAYLGIYQETDANGQVVFDLPAGETFLFRADILGSQYWSVAVTVQGGAINMVSVNAGGGRLQAVVRQDDTTVMPGIKVYLYSGSGTYLGVSGTTDETGTVGFNVTDAEYKLRADHLGYQFWSEPLQVTTDTTEPIVIGHQPARLTVQGRYQGVDTPFSGIKSYLFSSAGAYLGRSLTTDENGQATYSLPEKEYKIRADVLYGQYWSASFTWDNPVITIPIADARVTVTGAGLPKESLLVYVFTPAGAYLGINGTTDQTGQVTFRLPEGEYDFRADYQGSQFWARDRMLVADVVNDVAISVGGGAFQLTVKTDDDAPLAGVKCYVFDENDAYLGLSASTDDSGVAGFNLADGTVRLRADYLGHQFWSDPIAVAGDTEHTLVIAESTVRVRALSAGSAVVGARIYLFSASDTYLGQVATTDDQGEVAFDLPSGVAFRFRADILGGKYWSLEVTAADDLPAVLIDAGGGRLHVVVQTDTGTAFAELPVYLFNEDGNYLGLSLTTGADGGAAFDVPEGTYRIRADYLGYSFWEEGIQVTGDTDISLVIAVQPVAVTVVGGYQGTDTTLEGIRVYLFSPTGAYLDLSGNTDNQGRVFFDLPERAYKVRADTTGCQFWSDPFTWQDTTLRIPMAEAVVTVTCAGLPTTGVNVYLFSADDAYLGINQSTDGLGAVRFRLPAQTCKFRADYQANQYWSTDAVLEADMVNSVLISVGGGNVSLSVEKNGGVPMAGINCYVFADSGTYLGLKGATGEDGRVAFELADGSVQFRADYLGYQSWSGSLSIPDTLSQTMTINHADATVTFQGSYQRAIQPLEGRRVYLFTPSGAYLGQYRDTDADGRAVFNLPYQLYQVRCDELGQRYWSGSFQSQDTTVTVPMGKAVIHVTSSGEPAENARVYLFSDTDHYLGRYENTDASGTVRFTLPVGSYRFRADLDGRQQWTDITAITADLETAVNAVMD